MRYDNPILVLGLNYPGIDIIKYFQNEIVEIVGLDYRPDSAGFSLRAGVKKLCPDPMENPSEFVDFLLALKFVSPFKPVLFVTSDTFVRVLQNNREKLSYFFILNHSDNDINEIFLTKDGQYKFAMGSNLPTPKTFFPETINLQEMNNFPYILKPKFAPSWRSGELANLVNGGKIIFIRDSESLNDWVNRLHSLGSDFILQEIIPGPDENLIYLVFYIGKNHKCLGYFAGIKERITPIHFGSASFVRSLKDYGSLPIDSYINALEKSGYTGPAGVELKKDSKDGIFKLVEINPRFGLWDCLGKSVGVNLFSIAYQDLTQDQNQTICQPDLQEFHWLCIERDVSAFLEYYKEGSLSVFSWLRSLRPFSTIYAGIYFDEPKLFYTLYISRIVKKLRSLLHV